MLALLKGPYYPAIMDNQIEPMLALLTGPYYPPPIMDNQMDKKMEQKMEIGFIYGFLGIYVSSCHYSPD